MMNNLKAEIAMMKLAQGFTADTQEMIRIHQTKNTNLDDEIALLKQQEMDNQQMMTKFKDEIAMLTLAQCDNKRLEDENLRMMNNLKDEIAT